MQEKDREKVALFRYGLIAPILNGQVANQKEYLAEVAGKVHQVPHYGPKEFTHKTLAGWLLAYRRGLPRIVYVDNGKIYRSDTFQVACASLGIVLTHAQPYDAASKGKIERFFGTVKTRFMALLKSQPAKIPLRS